MSILDWIKLLDNLSNDEKDELSLFCQEKYVYKWEIIFEEWDIANAMYILVSWTIEISNIREWKKIILWNVKAEEILWEMALFWKKWNRMATAEVVEDAVLITILSFSIKDLIRKHSELYSKIRDIIELRIESNKLLE